MKSEENRSDLRRSNQMHSVVRRVAESGRNSEHPVVEGVAYEEFTTFLLTLSFFKKGT